MCANYGRVDLVFDYSVSLLERHLSLVRCLQFDFSSICFRRFVVNRVRACGDSILINVSIRLSFVTLLPVCNFNYLYNLLLF